MAKRRDATKDWRPVFLQAFREHMTVTAAAQAAGIGRRTAYDERARNPDFAADWADLEEEITESLEREAYRRAVEGVVERGTYDEDGNLVGEFVRKYSDRMMEMLLRARAPGKYRENVAVDMSGGVSVDQHVTIALLNGLQPVEIEPATRRAAARALLADGVIDGVGHTVEP